MPRPNLDTFDRKLLTLVQRDASRGADALAAEVGLSPSAVLRRLKRLREDGVIVATAAILDPLKVGKPNFFLAALEIERERPEHIARLRQWLAAEEWVQQIYYVTGTADFVLVVVAPDVGAYDALMSRLMADNPNVRRFTTNVALGVGKRSLFVPVEPAD
ncbi:Lrp/AsnC family transcriptional regulator [Sphingomonas psychrotolerans]|uniref:Lrp/AsnC family transcriptional regulator n=1 Tax=Sphingomonas psychrotolerans TaxID=1327635 RepID=A0A2K8MFY0_9SPHN|nr:Lrp/AsnC family transcriptional regulator [Sphingomonas psychrotolerans]ATY32788.1 Lrp/AsnC family transcriptional regulator [Sphingomonas psychrotolerans]